MEEIKIQLTKRIRVLRKEKYLKQVELADKANMSLVSIQRYEAEKRIPSLSILDEIFKALGTTLSEQMKLLKLSLNTNEKDVGDIVNLNIGNNILTLSRVEYDSILAKYTNVIDEFINNIILRELYIKGKLKE